MQQFAKCYSLVAVLFLFGCGGEGEGDGPAGDPPSNPLSEAQAAAQRSESTGHLKKIALAMHNHHDTYRNLPPSYSTAADGKPLLSWRVLILPFVEQSSLYDQFHLDEPWDSDHNKTLISRMPPIYSAAGSKSGDGKTNYLTFRHADSAFPGDRKVSFASTTDGTSNTLMVAEVTDEYAVTWTKPADLDFVDGTDILPALVGLRKGGFLTAFVDGSVRLLPDKIDRETLTRLIKRNDGNPVEIP